MDTTEEKESKINELELKEVLNAFQGIFKELSDNAELGSFLLDLNIKSSFSKELENGLKDPLKYCYDAFINLEDSLKVLISATANVFITNQKTKIKSAYLYTENNNVLYYYILLKDSDIKNKSMMYRFLSLYEATEYSERFPIVFQNVPSELEEELNEEVKGDNFIKIL